MPIYQYRCGRCGKAEELIRPISLRDTPVECQCGFTKERLMSTFNVGASSRSIPANDQMKGSLTRVNVDQSIATGISIGDCKGVKIKGGRATDCNIGIRMTKNSQVEIEGFQFENVQRPIEIA